MKVKIHTADNVDRKVLSTEVHLQVGGTPQLQELITKALRAYPQSVKCITITVWQSKDDVK